MNSMELNAHSIAFNLIGIMIGIHFVISRGNAAKRMVEWKAKMFGLDDSNKMKLYELMNVVMGIAVIAFCTFQIILMLS